MELGKMLKKKYKFYLKVHEKLNQRVVSICDEDILNKKYEFGGLSLDISERFYKGELIDEKIAEDYLKNENNLNLVGKNIIDLGLKLNLFENKDVLNIEGIPLTYIFMI